MDSPENAASASPLPPVIQPDRLTFWKSQRPFPPTIVALCFLLGMGSIAYRAKLYQGDPLHRLYNPAITAALFAQSIVEFEAGTFRVPPINEFHTFIMGQTVEWSTNEAVRVCESVLANRRSLRLSSSDEMAVRMVLGTLRGEAAETNKLVQLLIESDRLHPGNRVSAMLRHVYLDGTAPMGSIEAWPESEMVRGWAFDTLRGRLAAKRKDTAGVIEASTKIQQRGTELQIETLLLFGTNCAGMLAGTLIILRSMRGRWGTLHRPGERTMVRWAPIDALAVFMAGEFLATVLYPVVMWSGLWIAWFIGTYLYVLLSAAPFVVLAAVCLFQRNRVSLTDLFRLRGRAVVGGALALFALDLGGTILLNRVFEACNWQIPWAEALDEDLIYGTLSSKTATLVNMAVLAPFFEEFQMRAVLFAALRSRNSVFAAAFVSSTVFAALHFYSPGGFVSVWWFGFSAALVYERTRSLPACIAGHALTNAMIGTETLLVFA